MSHQKQLFSEILREPYSHRNSVSSMQSILSHFHYTDPGILEQERSKIFRQLWLFACLSSTLAAPNAYASLSLAGQPVLIQNCNGEIRAFKNQCPHRLVPLQAEGFGQSPMRCPYHGWTFNNDGSVKSIPHESNLYNFSSEKREKLCMKRYAVEIVGNMIFINLSENPLPIEKQFTPEILDKLRDISTHFSAQTAHITVEVDYNWKLQYENVLDYNHVPYVHPQSFLPLLTKDNSSNLTKKKIEQPSIPFFPDVPSTLNAQSYHTRAALKIPPQPWHSMVDRYGEGGFFENFFLFPNVNFNCAEGMIFKIEQYEPLTSSRTAVRFTMAVAKEKQRIRALPAILSGCIRNDVNVLHEDRMYLERLQKGLHAGSPKVHHGQYERYLISFAQVYEKLLKGERPW